MSKLPTGFQGALTHADIIQLLHDEVISLCQRSYGSVSGLEIDGIICISLLDTKEQQVVKIHKTLKSVVADTKKKQKRQKLGTHPPNWVPGILGNNVMPSYQQGPENFQSDINALSNLLKETNAAITKDLSIASKPSKRKGRQPRHRITKNVPDKVTESTNIGKDTTSRSKELNAQPNSAVDGNVQELPGVNPFIHKDVVTVKEEKVDPEYDAAEQTQPKIVDVSSVDESDKEKTSNSEVVLERQKVSSYIDSIIEREIPREKKSLEKSEEDKTIEADKETKSPANNKDVATDCEFQAVEIKVEKNIDESEYGGVQSNDQPNTHRAEFNNYAREENSAANGSYQFPLEWPFNQYTSPNELGKTALLDKLYEKGSLAHTGYPRERVRAEPHDPQGRSWIEMVKDNVNKYQAALERSNRGKSEGESSTSSSQTATVKTPTSLVALLKQPTPASLKSIEVTTNAILDSAPCSRGPSIPKQSTDQISERSASSSPVVKIEVDRENTEEMFPQSNEQLKSDHTNSELSQENNSPLTKPLQGKLESRYPALFSHLQQAKQAGSDGQDQTESLVNRLPFISFQELFSQAATGAPSPRLSESTTMQLLAQARINPYPSKEKPKTQRKVWNWKKRQVRPRDADGKIISQVPVRVKSPDSARKKRRLVLPASVRRALAKRGHQKSDQDKDKDWKPTADNVDVDSDVNVNSPDAPGEASRRTRLSCGEKPRINFAELENSDIEMEEEDDYEIENYEMPQGFIQKTFIGDINPFIYTDRPDEYNSEYNRGEVEQRLAGFGPSNIPENNSLGYPGGVGSEQIPKGLVPAGRSDESNSGYTTGGSEQILAGFSTSSEQINSAANAATEQYKCSLCGLEFNQEYRWQYHLIKVHGINEDKVKLFR